MLCFLAPGIVSSSFQNGKLHLSATFEPPCGQKLKDWQDKLLILGQFLILFQCRLLYFFFLWHQECFPNCQCDKMHLNDISETLL